MRKLLTIILSLVLPAILSAQNVAPDFEWVKGAGKKGVSEDYATSVTVDRSGYIYVAGNFEDSSIFGSIILPSKGNPDNFIAKLDSSGNFIWVKGFGGPFIDFSSSIETDTSGNIYFIGSYEITTTFENTTFTSQGDADIFIVKLDSSGSFIWAKSIGGAGDDLGYDITVCSSGNIYIMGRSDDSITLGDTTLISKDEGVIFVARLDSSGNFIWAKQMGGRGGMASQIAVNAKEHIAVAGTFGGEAHFGDTLLTSEYFGSPFVARLDSSGNFIWAIKTGEGNGYEYPTSIALDTWGNTYITGWYYDTCHFDNLSIISNGEAEIFIAKLNPSGKFTWAKGIGGAGDDFGYSIITDSSGNIYATGEFANSVTFGTTTLGSQGKDGLYITKLDSSGSFTWILNADAEYSIWGNIVTDNFGNLYCAGGYSGSSTFGNHMLQTELWDYDIFITKVSNKIVLQTSSINPAGSMQIYPNPVENILHINSEVSLKHIRLYDIMGKILYDCPQDNKRVELDMSQFNNGIFLIEVTSPDGEKKTQKIVKYY